MKINENQKVTLTIGQLKKLVMESAKTDADFRAFIARQKPEIGSWIKRERIAYILEQMSGRKIALDRVGVREDGFIVDGMKFIVDPDRAYDIAIQLAIPVQIERGPIGSSEKLLMLSSIVNAKTILLKQLVDLFKK